MIFEIFTALVALVFVLGLVLGGAWLVRRMGWLPGQIKGPMGRDITILEQRPVDAHTRIVALRWRGDDYLISVGAEQTALIDKKPSSATNSLEGDAREI